MTGEKINQEQNVEENVKTNLNEQIPESKNQTNDNFKYRLEGDIDFLI